jgi:hypothetical protein
MEKNEFLIILLESSLLWVQLAADRIVCVDGFKRVFGRCCFLVVHANDDEKVF